MRTATRRATVYGGRSAASLTPDQITGLQLWLKADAITGLNDADAITTWADSSGNGRNAAQATAGKRPMYKTGIVNGLPVVRFSHIDGGDRLDVGTIRTANGNVSVFVVDARPTLLNAQPNQREIRANNGTGTEYTAPNWIVTGKDAAGSAIVYPPRIQTIVHSAGLWHIQSISLGYSADAYHFQGDIAEVIIYDSALSDANRQAVEAYLSAKYGIALA